MFTTDQKIARVVGWVARVVAITVAIVLPLGYYGLRYSALLSEVRTIAAAEAEVVNRIVSANPELWMFESSRLEELISRGWSGDVHGSIRIMDSGDRVIAEAGEPRRGPGLATSVTLFDSGTAVGRVEVSHSLNELLLGTAVAATAGLVLAVAVFLALHALPLRALRRAIDSLAREKERAEVTLHSIGDAVITVDAQENVDYLNPVAEQLTGWRTGEAKGRPLGEIFRLVHELSQEPVENPLRRAMAERRIMPLADRIALVRRGGTTVAIEDNAAPILDKEGRVVGGVLVFHDVSVARDMADRLSWQATHDALTGLVNRAEFERRLKDALNVSHAEGKHHALCYFDLDQFKVVNDSCGHAAGDELLRQITLLLQSRIRASDTLARIGGDEFGLLLEGCALDQAQRIAADLLGAVREFRFTWKNKAFTVGASIGVVALTRTTTDAEQLLSIADTACYVAKENGRNRIQVYRAHDQEIVNRREQMGWVSRITRALEEDRFTLYYQPYLELARSLPRAPHVELLLRLIDENGRIVAPGSFIPAAERYNLMPSLDRWVIKTAFRDFSTLVEKFDPNLVCSINLSGTSFNSENFTDFIRDQAALHKVPPRAICFEITETAAVNNLRSTGQFIAELRKDGFRFALDDFGVGMSSFSYLKNLPVDYLKIDGSFVKEIASDPVSRTIVRAISQVGRAMGIHTIAEFVENDAVLEQLRAIGVDFAQGYLVGKPSPLPGSHRAEIQARVAAAA